MEEIGDIGLGNLEELNVQYSEGKYTEYLTKYRAGGSTQRGIQIHRSN